MFQLLNAVMVLRGIASVPAERLQIKRASVEDDTTQLVLVRPVQPKCVGWSRLDMTRLAACPVTRTSFTSDQHHLSTAENNVAHVAHPRGEPARSLQSASALGRRGWRQLGQVHGLCLGGCSCGCAMAATFVHSLQLLLSCRNAVSYTHLRAHET